LYYIDSIMNISEFIIIDFENIVELVDYFELVLIDCFFEHLFENVDYKFMVINTYLKEIE